MNYRLSSDGFLDLRDQRRVRTPGQHDSGVPPISEANALSFLLSHSFPGHRRIVRRLSTSDRKKIRVAMWADSVSERMTLVDRVWRSMTEPVLPPPDPSEPHLVQIVSYGDSWAYPVHLDGEVTRVIPHGGLAVTELEGHQASAVDQGSAVDLKTA